MFFLRFWIRNYYKMTTLDTANIAEPVRLCEDCWSVVLSFLPTRTRILVAPIDKEIFASLQNSFTGQTTRWGDCRNITDAGLAHLKNAKNINLGHSRSITDAGLAHLRNVENINLY